MNQPHQFASEPEFLSVSMMLKATPQMDGGRRIIYCEASNETTDAQNEVVMQKALSESMEYMLARGNFDLDHITMTGAKMGIPDYLLYEIGRPTEIRFKGGKTFVKGEIYSGSGPAAERANYFWSSLTDISPPARWFPSVGGQVLKAETVIDPKTRTSQRKITGVRWANIGYSKQPVNQHVATVETVPMDVFAKSWAADGFSMTKSLEAGYGADSATLTGGSAMRTQSLDHKVQSYFDFRNKLSERMRSGGTGKNPGARELVEFATKEFGIGSDRAAEWMERFMRDLKNGLNKRSKS